MRRRSVVIAAAIAGAVIAGGAVWLLTASAGESPRAAGHGVEKNVDPTDAMERVQQKFDEHLATCLEPAAEVPESCGIAIPWAADLAVVTRVEYHVEQAPVLTLAPSPTLAPSTFRADDGVLIATVIGTGLDGAPRTMTYRTENWMLRGDVLTEHGDIELSVW